jgi:integrase
VAEADGGSEVHPEKVQEWLGHARPSTTLDTWVHETVEDEDQFLTETLRPPGRKVA